MEVKISSINDLGEIVNCHMKAFPQSLSTKLGKYFCSRMLSWYVNEPRGLMIHIEENEKIVGYCGGIKNELPGLQGASTTITQYCFRKFIISFAFRPWLFFHPENVKRYKFIIRNIFLKISPKNEKSKENSTDYFTPSWGLVVIGLDPLYNGKGFGSALLAEFEHLAKLAGINEVSLSVKQKNKIAIKAYLKNNWVINKPYDDAYSMKKKLI
jgi:GNAT superfamily N-acetyltransferase